MQELSIRKIFKNVLFVFGSQIVILIISVSRSLVLPAFFSVESYGYWQIYLFYSAYVGVFAFGFNDGIYLRYGDKDYKDLPFAKLRSSIKLFSFMLLFVTSVIIILIFLTTADIDLQFALIFSALNVYILGLTGVFTYVLQITNQLKKYSIFSVADKFLVLITVFLMFFVNYSNYKFIIAIDFTAKIIVLTSMIYLCKDLWVGKNVQMITAFKEFKNNIKVGINLLIANLLGMLIIGLGRFLIQLFADLKDFAVYSFGISITGIVITAVTAFSLVLYPTIKRLNKSKYDIYFKNINLSIIVFNFLVLLLYFICYWGVTNFYNKFIEMLPYLNLLFVVAVLQGKMSVLNNTFYKILRKEKTMLLVNIGSIIFFVIAAPLLFFFLESIWSIAFVTFITMMIRCYISEAFLKKTMKIRLDYKFAIEIIFIILFVVTTTFMQFKYSILLSLSFLMIMVSINISEIRKVFNQFVRIN